MFLAKYYSGDKTKKEMGWTCGMYWAEDRWIQGYSGGDPRHIDLDRDGSIILKLILKKHDGNHRLD